MHNPTSPKEVWNGGIETLELAWSSATKWPFHRRRCNMHHVDIPDNCPRRLEEAGWLHPERRGFVDFSGILTEGSRPLDRVYEGDEVGVRSGGECYSFTMNRSMGFMRIAPA